MHDQSTPINEFLQAVAARTPTPGGGSVAALAGALAAATGAMVIQYSLGKKDLAAYQDELRPALAEFDRARNMLATLMEEDQTAYEALSAIRKLPETDPSRGKKFSAALVSSIRVPQAVAATGVAILELCDKMVNFVNPQLVSDLAVCADLAMATIRCAQYNVRANLPELADEAERRSISQSNNQILSRAAALIQNLSPRIWKQQA